MYVFRVLVSYTCAYIEAHTGTWVRAFRREGRSQSKREQETLEATELPGLCQHAWAACEETAAEPWFNRHPQALWFHFSFQIRHSERTFHLFLEDSEFLKIGKTQS